jgi:hypothetical protein
MKNFAKDLWISQISLITLLVICCFIVPSVVKSNGGVSNFGNHRSTVVLYSLAFSLCVIFLSLAAIQLKKLNSEHGRKAVSLIVLAGLELLVLISTYPRHISYTYSAIHDYIGIALFLYQLILAIWFVFKLRNNKTIALLVAQFLGSTIGLLSILKIIHFLFVGQVIGAAAFGILLAGTMPRIITASLEIEKN